ncbi:hypothetical protein MyNCGM152_40870 [Achromobacter xylosoxidans]
MKTQDRKHLMWLAIFAAIFAVAFYTARQESRIEGAQVRTDCVRESYRMSEEHGGSQREWERDCLHRREEDALDRLNARTQ